MKQFIYTEKSVKINRTYGGAKIVLSIYRVKNNKPDWIGEKTYNTSSTMGAISEVNAFLINNKFILKTWSKRRSQMKDNDNMINTLYYSSYNQDKYRIAEV